MAESSGQSLIQCGKIIERTLAVIASYGETPIFAFLRDRVLEHHHGGNLECTAHRVRDVVALDTQRRLLQTQGLRHLVHGACAGAHIADTTHLRTLQRLRGVLVRTIHELFLITAHGDTY